MESYVCLNHGRWSIGCPVCNASFYGDGRNEWALAWGTPEFLCTAINGRGDVCGAGPVTVIWPPDRLRDAIEIAVGPRPEENRNWHFGVTIEELREENRAYLPATEVGLTVIAVPDPVLLVVKHPGRKLAALQDALVGEYVLRHDDEAGTIEVEVTDGRTIDDLHELVRPHAKTVG